MRSFKRPDGLNMRFSIKLDKEDYHMCISVTLCGHTADEYIDMIVSERGIRFLFNNHMNVIKYAYISEFTDNKAIASGPVIECHASGDDADSYTISGFMHPQISRPIRMSRVTMDTMFDMLFEYLPKYCEESMAKLETRLKTYIKTWEILKNRKGHSQEG